MRRAVSLPQLSYGTCWRLLKKFCLLFVWNVVEFLSTKHIPVAVHMNIAVLTSYMSYNCNAVTVTERKQHVHWRQWKGDWSHCWRETQRHVWHDQEVFQVVVDSRNVVWSHRGHWTAANYDIFVRTTFSCYFYCCMCCAGKRLCSHQFSPCFCRFSPLQTAVAAGRPAAAWYIRPVCGCTYSVQSRPLDVGGENKTFGGECSMAFEGRKSSNGVQGRSPSRRSGGRRNWSLFINEYMKFRCSGKKMCKDECRYAYIGTHTQT